MRGFPITLLALLLIGVMTMTACNTGTSKQTTGTTTPGGTSGTASAMTSDTNGGGSGGIGDESGLGSGSGSGGIGDESGLGSGSGGSMGVGDSITGAMVMVDGTVYVVTDEELRTDQLGEELTSVSGGVTGTPENDGEAQGLDEGTKIYALTEVNDKSSVAVEFDGAYYRATRQE